MKLTSKEISYIIPLGHRTWINFKGEIWWFDTIAGNGDLIYRLEGSHGEVRHALITQS